MVLILQSNNSQMTNINRFQYKNRIKVEAIKTDLFSHDSIQENTMIKLKEGPKLKGQCVETYDDSVFP